MYEVRSFVSGMFDILRQAITNFTAAVKIGRDGFLRDLRRIRT